MKLGSIVICVSDTVIPGYEDAPEVLKGVPYTVRDIYKEDGYLWIELEELPGGIGYYALDFREIEFPTAFLTEIEEAINRELVEK